MSSKPKEYPEKYTENILLLLKWREKINIEFLENEKNDTDECPNFKVCGNKINIEFANDCYHGRCIYCDMEFGEWRGGKGNLIFEKEIECPICFETINDERCRMCENHHKFHNKCYPEQEKETDECPTCKNKDIEPCIYNSKSGIPYGNYNDVYSGGKRKRKSRKTNRKRNRKTNRKRNRKSKRRVSKYIRT
jgi:hypothetical protein